MAGITAYDAEQGEIDACRKARTILRLKFVDVRREFKRYFWKAAPI